MLAIFGEAGRLEEFFSDYIYPVWPLFAILGVLAVAGAAYLALRLGWHQIARRHPLISCVAAAAILAVSVPTGYYVAWPLLDRSLACEASPLAGTGAGSDRCEEQLVTQPNDGASPATQAPTSEAPTATPNATGHPCVRTIIPGGRGPAGRVPRHRRLPFRQRQSPADRDGTGDVHAQVRGVLRAERA